MKKYLILLAKLIVFAIAMGSFMMVLMLPLASTGIVDVNNPGRWAILLIEAVQLASVLLAAWLIIRFWDKVPFVANMGFGLQGRGKDMLYGFAMAAAIYAIGYIVSLIAGWIRIDARLRTRSHARYRHEQVPRAGALSLHLCLSALGQPRHDQLLAVQPHVGWHPAGCNLYLYPQPLVPHQSASVLELHPGPHLGL